MQTNKSLTRHWTEVLACVEQALAEAVAKVQKRDQALANAAAVPVQQRAPDFGAFEAKAADLASCPQRAEQGVMQQDVSLGECEEELRQWLARSEAVRRQLATWVGRAIG
jgi:hypothetical protein